METVHYRNLTLLINKELPPSKWITVDQDLIDAFADATGDHQWIHVDVERAKKEIGGTIAHGFLTLSLMPSMVHDVLKVEGLARALNYGFDKIRFTGVVPAGAKVRMRQTVTKIEDKNGGKLMTRSCLVEVMGPDGKMHEKPAISALWLGLVFPADDTAGSAQTH
ncbi:MAG: MaoC family dehydratase [Hyphomicrobiaceae bacterium]|nr:MaoC family dehydratase [Hyphomicrobiaceae bacterium]